ncbi:M protein repeat protein [Aphelenchoides bicaudatus]|nr:M protein repeat protein [Aphelenchoides bicaudatus]
MAKPVREIFYYQRRQIPYRTYAEGKWTRNSAAIMELVEQVAEIENDELSERQSTTETIVANGASEQEWNKRAVDPSVLEELEKLRNADVANRTKIQKLQENLKDEREELENLKSRNEFLEKRGQNVNSEVQVYKDQIEELISVKEKLERDFSDSTANLNKKIAEIQELRDQNAEIRTNLMRARRDVDEMTDDANRSGSTAEAELVTLRKNKRDLEQKVNDLEDQLDEAQGQNDILEQNVTRLNLNLERLRSDNQRTSDAKDEELEESRSQFQRRLRAYEEQIAELNAVNANLQRQIRVLEQRGRQFETQSQYSFESSTNNYKREYKKTLAMLKDTQNLLAIERQKGDKTALIRRLRTQLEEAEEGSNECFAFKDFIENIRMAKTSLEQRVKTLLQEKSDAVLASKDIEEQLNNALRDYRNNLSKTEQNSAVINTQSQQIAELEAEKQKLSVQLAETESHTANYKSNYVEAHKLQLLESRFAELKARADYERLEKQKFEANVQRLEDEVDRLEIQLSELQKTVGKQQDQIQKHKREVLFEQEKANEIRKSKEELEYKLRKSREECEENGEEHERLKSDLLLAQRRIEGLQAALNAGSEVDEDDRLNDLSDDEESVTTTTDNLTHNDSGDHSNSALPLNESVAS